MKKHLQRIPTLFIYLMLWHTIYSNAGKELAWQYLLASDTLSKDTRSGNIGRHHLNLRTVQITGPCEYEHNDDLYPCIKQRRQRR